MASPPKKRFRRGPTMGGLNVSWRWEVGAPLFLIGAVICGAALRVDGAAVMFWLGAVLMASGAACFVLQSR